ncbi:hypothetical protein [Lactobacillus apis]|uniref:hypothetical protein n=1 Tax=Lactobacillus apis TaxID=303541 RepID=UPI000A478613|nr:hypothetical protein [Lactobacillus apis]
MANYKVDATELSRHYRIRRSKEIIASEKYFMGLKTSLKISMNWKMQSEKNQKQPKKD